MKLPFIKFKKNDTPAIWSLRPPIFDVYRGWQITLVVTALLFIITLLVGAKLFYAGYFETYKTRNTRENFQNLINVKKLKTLIEKRNNAMSEKAVLPGDPSL